MLKSLFGNRPMVPCGERCKYRVGRSKILGWWKHNWAWHRTVWNRMRGTFARYMLCECKDTEPIDALAFEQEVQSTLGLLWLKQPQGNWDHRIKHCGWAGPGRAGHKGVQEGSYRPMQLLKRLNATTQTIVYLDPMWNHFGVWKKATGVALYGHRYFPMDAVEFACV